MNVVRKGALALFLILLTSGVEPVEGVTPTPPSRIPDSEFIEIYPNDPIPVIEDRLQTPPVPTKPRIHIPNSQIIAVPVPQKTSAKSLKGNFTSGVASYYCLAGESRCTVGHPDVGGNQFYAAIRKDLLYLKGKTVQVCKYGTTRCVNVTIIDCNCGKNANLIDLYSDAFKKLTDIWRGTVKVTVKW